MALTKINDRSGYSVDLSNYLTSVSQADLPTGSVLQVYNQHSTATNSYNATSANLFTATLTAKSSNSSFIIMTGISYGSPTDSTNADSWDIAFSLRRSVNAGSDSVLAGGSNWTRTVDGSGEESWYLTDVPWSPNNGDTHIGGYDTFHRTLQYTDAPSHSAGDTVAYTIKMRCQQNFYFNGSRLASTNGSASYITVMEIAG